MRNKPDYPAQHTLSAGKYVAWNSASSFPEATSLICALFLLTHFLKARIAPFCSPWVSTDGLVVTGSFCSGLNWDKPVGELEWCMAIRGIIIFGWLWILAMLDLKTKHIRWKVSRLAIFNFQMYKKLFNTLFKYFRKTFDHLRIDRPLTGSPICLIHVISLVSILFFACSDWLLKLKISSSIHWFISRLLATPHSRKLRAQ